MCCDPVSIFLSVVHHKPVFYQNGSTQNHANNSAQFSDATDLGKIQTGHPQLGIKCTCPNHINVMGEARHFKFGMQINIDEY